VSKWTIKRAVGAAKKRRRRKNPKRRDVGVEANNPLTPAWRDF